MGNIPYRKTCEMYLARLRIYTFNMTSSSDRIRQSPWSAGQPEEEDLDSMKREHPLLSLVIPAFNEGNHIGKNLEESVKELRAIGEPFQIVVVNDGSSDDTKKEIESIALHHPEIVFVSYVGNIGKGNALKSGCRSATGDFVAFMDGDLEIHPRQLLRFLEEMEKTGADVVIGSKRHPGSRVDYPLKRRFLSWGYNMFVRTLFDLKVNDTQLGFKLFRREVLDKELPKMVVRRWAFDLELLTNAHMDGFKIVEAPIELSFNRKDGGGIGFRTVGGVFLDTLGIFYRLRIAGHHVRTGQSSGSWQSHNRDRSSQQESLRKR
jgi:dolichol-phosphate mannosyltransferase